MDRDKLQKSNIKHKKEKKKKSLEEPQRKVWYPTSIKMWFSSVGS